MVKSLGPPFREYSGYDAPEPKLIRWRQRRFLGIVCECQCECECVCMCV